MKKTLSIIISVLMIVCLTACGWNSSKSDTAKNDDRMTLIYNNGFVQIYADNDTGVQYLLGSNRGVCVMVDENGEPLLYDPTEKGGAEE